METKANGLCDLALQTRIDEHVTLGLGGAASFELKGDRLCLSGTVQIAWLDKLLASPSDGVYEVQVVGVTSPTEEDQELLSQVLQRLCGPSLKILRLINSPLSPPLHHQLNLFLTIYACVEELEVSFSGGFRTLADIAASACVKPELHTLILRGSGGFDTESGQKLLSGCRGRTFPERTLIEGSGRPEQVTERPMVLGANEMVRATNQMRVVRWNYDAEGRPALFLRTDLWREDSVPRPPKENLPRQALRLRGGTLLDVSDAFQKALPAGRYVIIWWLQFRPTWSFKKPLRLSASVCYGGKRLELIRHVSFSPEPDQWKEAEVGCFELETDEVVTIVSRLEEQWQLDHKGGLLVLGHELQKDPPARTATDERTRAGPEKGEPEVLRIELQTNPPASITDEEVSAGAEKGGLGVLELNLQTGPPASTAEDERISARDLCGVTRPRSVSFQVACATHADSNFLSLGESAQNPVSTTVASPLRDAAERGDAHASETTRNGSVKRPFSGNLTRRLLNMISKWQCFGRT